MKKYKPKICEECGEEFTPVSPHGKYCDRCRPAMIKAQNKAAYERNKYKKRVRKYKPKGNNFDERTREAKKLGISYGMLQAMRYMESMKA